MPINIRKMTVVSSTVHEIFNKHRLWVSQTQRECRCYKQSASSTGLILKIMYMFEKILFQANRWCTKGVDLLASQAIEKCSTEAGAQAALTEIDALMESANEMSLEDPKEFHRKYNKVITAEILVRK